MFWGKYNIIISFCHWNKSEAAICRVQADAPDAYFTLPVGPTCAPPVDNECPGTPKSPAKIGGGDIVWGEYNIVMSLGCRNKSEAAICRAQADAPDAYFTLPVGPDQAPPVDNALTHKINSKNRWGKHGLGHIQYCHEFGSLGQI
jgi:hypothetical protein